MQSLLLSQGYTIKEIIYEQDVELIVFVFIDEIDKFVDTMVEATNDRVIIVPGDDTYITLDMNGKLIL